MEESNTLQKLIAIATDLTIDGELRNRAIMQLGIKMVRYRHKKSPALDTTAGRNTHPNPLSEIG